MCDRCGFEADATEDMDVHECPLLPTDCEDVDEALPTTSINLSQYCKKCWIYFHTPEECQDHIEKKHGGEVPDDDGSTGLKVDVETIDKKLAKGIKRSPSVDWQMKKKKKKMKMAVPNMQVDTGEEPRFPCPECDMKYFVKVAMDNHMQKEHGISPQFPCHICGMTYYKVEKLHKHMKDQHEGKIKQHAFMCWLCKEKNQKKSYSMRSKLETHLKSWHKLAKSQIDWSKMPVVEIKTEGDIKEEEKETDVDVPSKKLKIDGEDTFTCAKCDFVCEGREEFVEHIPRHKSEEESEQCQECGMCFVVLTSLKRHLFMVHKIRDFTKYSEETGMQMDPTIATRPSLKSSGQRFSRRQSQKTRGMTGENGTPLECTVCYREFESENTLRTHMRNHGMAFIRSKRSTAWEF